MNDVNRWDRGRMADPNCHDLQKRRRARMAAEEVDGMVVLLFIHHRRKKKTRIMMNDGPADPTNCPQTQLQKSECLPSYLTMTTTTMMNRCHQSRLRQSRDCLRRTSKRGPRKIVRSCAPHNRPDSILNPNIESVRASDEYD